MTPYKALILAAGTGTRMGILTADKAKPSLEVGGKSLVGRLVQNLTKLQSGPEEIFVNIHHAPMSIIQALDAENHLQDVNFFWEPHLLGSALTLWSLQQSTNSAILVIHGDLLLSQDTFEYLLCDLEIKSNIPVVYHHYRRAEQARSMITFDEKYRVRSFNETPGSIKENVATNSGIYFFPKGSLNRLSKPSYGESVAVRTMLDLVRHRSLLTSPIRGAFRASIETSEGLLSARKFYHGNKQLF